MCIFVRDYRNDAPGGVQRAIELQGVSSRFFAGVPWLHAYHAVDNGDGCLVTISVYANGISAEESNMVRCQLRPGQHGQMGTGSARADPGRGCDHRALNKRVFRYVLRGS
jgi:hypothetical protein